MVSAGQNQGERRDVGQDLVESQDVVQVAGQDQVESQDVGRVVGQDQVVCQNVGWGCRSKS